MFRLSIYNRTIIWLLITDLQSNHNMSNSYIEWHCTGDCILVGRNRNRLMHSCKFPFLWLSANVEYLLKCKMTNSVIYIYFRMHVLFSTSYYWAMHICELNKSITDIQMDSRKVSDKLSSCRPLKICISWNEQDHSEQFESWITLHVHSVGCRLARTSQ